MIVMAPQKLVVQLSGLASSCPAITSWALDCSDELKQCLPPLNNPTPCKEIHALSSWVQKESFKGHLF